MPLPVLHASLIPLFFLTWCGSAFKNSAATVSLLLPTPAAASHSL